MRGLAELAELAAKIFADRLHAEADAKNRQLLADRGVDGFRDAKILRPARTRRQHQKIPLPLQHFLRVNVAHHRDAGADLAEIIRQHMHKAVVVIDQQHFFARAGGIGRERRQRLWRIAAQRLEQRGGLDLALAVFRRGIGVEQAGGADADFGKAVLHADGADGQAGVDAAVEIDGADRAGVPAPRRALVILDELHRPQFWRARHGHGPGMGEESIQRVKAGAQHALDMIDGVKQL